MQIKSLIIVLLLSSFLMFCGPDVKVILKESYNKCQSIQNGYYEMTRSTNLTDGKDGPIDSYTCYFKKLNEDSLFSSAFLYKHYHKRKYKGDVIYTGDDFVSTDVKDSTATIMSKARWAKDIKANSYNYIFYSPLTSRNSSPLPHDSDYIDGKHIFKYIGEENINNNICYHIRENDISVDEKDSPITTLKSEYHF